MPLSNCKCFAIYFCRISDLFKFNGSRCAFDSAFINWIGHSNSMIWQIYYLFKTVEIRLVVIWECWCSRVVQIVVNSKWNFNPFGFERSAFFSLSHWSRNWLNYQLARRDSFYSNRVFLLFLISVWNFFFICVHANAINLKLIFRSFITCDCWNEILLLS